MPKSVTVEFKDGTSHTYDNVPDNIDDETVRERAANEFSSKEVAVIGPGKVAEEEGPSTFTKAVGGAETAFNVAKDVITNPLVEMAIGGYGAKKVFLDPILEAVKSRGVSGPVAPGPNIQVPPNTGGVPRPMGATGTPAQTFEALRTPPPAASAVAPAAEAQPGIIQRGMNVARQLGQSATNLAPGGLGQAMLGSAVPAAAFSMPYAGAAYEQSKIRQNLNAPQYANNPYAMQQRGQAPTQGSAGAANRRAAIAGQQYGGLSQAQQDALEQDRLDRAIRLKAAKKVLGQP